MLKTFFFAALTAVAFCQRNNEELEAMLTKIFREEPVVDPVTPGPTEDRNLGPSDPSFLNHTCIAQPSRTEDKSCTTVSGEDGECVKYFQCNNNTSIEYGSGIAAILSLNGGKCSCYLDTCCLLAEKRPAGEPISPRPPPKQELQPPFRPEELITDRITDGVRSPLPGGPCVLPPYPPNGNYTVINIPGAVPGQSASSVALNISCYLGYGLTSSAERLCVGGVWQPTTISNNECVRFCRLIKDPSVHFRCLLTGSFDGLRECNEYEPEGTLVAPACNEPHYYHKGVLRYMRCIDGQWNYITRCYAECGKVAAGVELIIGGGLAENGELPWHAGIYRKTTDPYMQICGGSLISSKVVISAAHCFWDDTLKAQPASNYAVALGKLYRPWAYKKDQDVQRSDVEDIKMTPYFQGRAANFQADIAILLLTSVIEFQANIRPVCIDFNVVFESRQLSPGNKGKVAGWGLAAENGNASLVLKVVELPYISIQECQTEAPISFRGFITTDKFCAGFRNGTSVCQGDSGGGLVFPDQDQGFVRYYLRGIVSTAPMADSLCNSNWLATFTQISRHERFITNYF